MVVVHVCVCARMCKGCWRSPLTDTPPRRRRRHHHRPPECDATVAGLARENIGLNALDSRVRLIDADLFDATERKRQGLAEAADLVVTNPPFLAAGEARPAWLDALARSNDPLTRAASVMLLRFTADRLPDLATRLQSAAGDAHPRRTRARTRC